MLTAVTTETSDRSINTTSVFYRATKAREQQKAYSNRNRNLTFNRVLHVTTLDGESRSQRRALR